MVRNFEQNIHRDKIEEIFTPVAGEPRPLEFDEPRVNASALRRRLFG